MNIAVFASGNGSNFASIVASLRSKKIPAKLKLLVCDNPRAKVIQRANKAGVEVFLIDYSAFVNFLDLEKVVVSRLKQEGIDLIVLAGFMRLLSPYFVRAFKNRIINIHPSLLPASKADMALRMPLSME